MQTLTADASGSAIAKITWPSSAHTDQMPFAAIGETTHLVAKGTHPVDPTLLTTTTDEIDADGNAGDTVLFNGKDFAAVEKVTIAFNGTGHIHDDKSQRWFFCGFCCNSSYGKCE